MTSLAFIMWNTIREFYSSKQWTQCAIAYRKSKQGLCERCLKKGLIVPCDEVHHKIRLTKENINNPQISLNFDNLEALCSECHDKEHEADIKNRWKSKKRRTSNRRYAIDSKSGKVISKPEHWS